MCLKNGESWCWCHASIIFFLEACALFYDIICDVDFYLGVDDFTIWDVKSKMYMAFVILYMHQEIFFGESFLCASHSEFGISRDTSCTRWIFIRIIGMHLHMYVRDVCSHIGHRVWSQWASKLELLLPLECIAHMPWSWSIYMLYVSSSIIVYGSHSLSTYEPQS